MKNQILYSVLLSSAFVFSGCNRLFISQKKNIVYSQEQQLELNVFSPRKKNKELKKVLVFIHGGNWKTGNKSMYNFLGKGMAKKGIVTVVIDYRLYPFTYSEMAMDVAQSLKWINQNIASFGGDPSDIFVSGHSAGGHLAALISADSTYFDTLKIKNPVKGCILIDAFGLDMYTYLNKGEKYEFDVYRRVFTQDPEKWKAASPVYHLHKGMPPFMLYVGEKTYPGIINGSSDFLEALKKYQPEAAIIKVPRKRHAAMILSYVNPRKKAYREIRDFMEKAN